ncbi:PDZ domain-containing protein, partial [Methylobacterium frigidaeris]
VVVRVLPGSPAAAAGLEGVDSATGELGDIIMGVNGRPVRRLADLIAALESAGVGSSVALQVERDGRAITLMVTPADMGQRRR